MKWTVCEKRVSQNGEEYWLFTHNEFADEAWRAAEEVVASGKIAEEGEFILGEEGHGSAPVLRRYKARAPRPVLKAVRA